VPRWQVIVETAGFVMSSSWDEQALAVVSEGVRTLMEQRSGTEVDVQGIGPEGFVRAVFEFDSLTAGAAAVECESVISHALEIAVGVEAIPAESSRIERIRAARAPIGDEWEVE
jgi:hypothetical protein